MTNNFSKSTLYGISCVLSAVIESVYCDDQTTTTTTPRPMNFYNFGYVGPWPSMAIPTIASIALIGTVGATIYHAYNKYHNYNQNEEQNIDCLGEGTELQEILS